MPTPPGTPSLSALPIPGVELGAGQAGNLPRLFFDVESRLKDLALQIPSSSGRIDAMIQELRSLMAESMTRGAGPTPPPTGMMGGAGGML